MYLRALPRTSSRCSATVSLVMRGTLAKASSMSSSGALRRFSSDGRLSCGLGNFVFFGRFIRFGGLVLRRILGTGDPLLAQNRQNSFLNLGGVMDIVNGYIPHVRLHLNCTKAEQRFLQAGDFVIDGLDLLQPDIGDAAVEQAF